ncbi:MAG: hypothetical protein HYZ89_00665 [Candidatus Omnitrophica bacterium]|nr:hypothetical protein [Candidatus Omnitrophota bacterium]
MKLLVTEESGRLSRWLRLMGYDTAQAEGASLSAVYRTAYNERRIVLTRNSRVKESRLFRVVHLRSTLLEEQLRQLVRELPLAASEERWFTRCDRCNVPVEPIERALVKERVPPYVYETQRTFRACPSCHRIYWAATHWHRARALFGRINA